MAQLYQILKPQLKYYDRKSFGSQQQYNQALSITSTVYVGNLSFYTSQQSINELFSRAGLIKQIIMGINDQGHPCGFCFVIFETHQDALYAVQYISKTKLCDRVIRVDWDAGYKKGRQKGRGKDGQQKRDDFRRGEDAQRPKKKVHTNSYQNKKYDRGDRVERGQRYGNRHDNHGDRHQNYNSNYNSDRHQRRQRNDRFEKIQKNVEVKNQKEQQQQIEEY